MELLVTVAVLGLLASISVPLFNEYRSKAYDAMAISDLRNLFTAYHAGESLNYVAETGSAGYISISCITDRVLSNNSITCYCHLADCSGLSNQQIIDKMIPRFQGSPGVYSKIDISGGFVAVASHCEKGTSLIDTGTAIRITKAFMLDSSLNQIVSNMSVVAIMGTTSSCTIP